jgi:signal transduction histidine kinase
VPGGSSRACRSTGNGGGTDRPRLRNELVEALTSSLVPEEVGRAALDAASRVAGVTRVAVLIHDDPGMMDSRPSRRRLKPLASHRLSPAEAESQASDPAIREFLSGSGALPEPVPGVPTRIPFRLGGRVGDLGVLLVWVEGPTTEAESQLPTICRWVGAALERTLLYRRLEVAYSDLMKAQRRLLLAEKQSAIGRLAAGLAHEVGTPLNIISGRAEYLMAGADARTAAGLAVIVQQIDRISVLIRQLLDFSREYTPLREKVSLTAVMASVTPLLEGPLSSARIRLDVSQASGLPDVVANANAIQQVFINLLMNSIDAIMADPGHLQGKGDGVIGIRSSFDPSEERVVVQVSDNGHGIREEHLDKVFDPFFSTKDVGKGTGLGLAVVYGIVTEHGGTIEIDSTWGRGTMVTFTLPTA